MQKFATLLLILLCSYANTTFAGGDFYWLHKKEVIESRFANDYALENKIASIEKIITSDPEQAINKLDVIVKKAIEGNLLRSQVRGYWLMGKAYKELQQGKIALHFMQLSLDSRDKLDQSIADHAEASHRSGGLQLHEKKSLLKKMVTATPVTNIARDKSFQFLLDLGEIHSISGDHTNSNRIFKKYLDSVTDVSLKNKVNFKIAQNYYHAKVYNKAIKRYQNLLKQRAVQQNANLRSTCNSRIAASYISLGNTKEGLKYYQLSLQRNTNDVQSNNNEASKNKEEVTKALREQKEFKEEVKVRADYLQTNNDGLEHLKLAQSYFADGNFDKSEESIDKYFDDISYNLIDTKEIIVIKKLALRMNSLGVKEKALAYLLQYENLNDTITSRLEVMQKHTKRFGNVGYQSALELESLQKDKEMSNNAIVHLMKEQGLQEDLVGFQKGLIYLLSVLIFAVLGTTLYIVKVSKQRRIANQQLALRSLRSQMNPHFIFNALNSVNSFISMNDERSANKFLSEFSSLMRSVMENSEHDFIPLSKELEILELYIGLEHYRFKDKFQYEITVDPDVSSDDLVIPPMLIQPFIENSIWHGLRYKESEGLLHLNISIQNKNLLVTIQDNGIGIKRSQELKTKNQKKNKSTALKNIDERVTLIRGLHNIQVSVETQSVNADGTGTLIKLTIPQPKHK